MQFTHEHEEVRRTLKRVIDNEINPHVDEWEKAEQFPAHEVFKKLGDLGLLGLTKPEAFGGAGLDFSKLTSFIVNPATIGVYQSVQTEVMAAAGA